MRCERYAGALYNYEPSEQRGTRTRWREVAARYCAAAGAPDPDGGRLLQTARDLNGP
jgi:hypothetical protein